eukprot:gene9842-7045_t
MDEEETRPEGEREDAAAQDPHEHSAEASSPLESPPAVQHINDPATSDTAIDDDYDLLLLQEAQAVTAALPVAAEGGPAVETTPIAATAAAVDEDNEQFDTEEDEYERLLREADAVAAVAAGSGDERLPQEADAVAGAEAAPTAALITATSASTDAAAEAVVSSTAPQEAASVAVEADEPSASPPMAAAVTADEPSASPPMAAAVTAEVVGPAEAAAVTAEAAAVTAEAAVPSASPEAASAAALDTAAAEAAETVDDADDDAYERLLREEQPAARPPVADSAAIEAAAPQPSQKPQPPKKMTLEALQRYTPPPSSSQAATSARPLLRPISASRAALDASEPPPRKPAVPRLSAAALGAARKTFLTSLPGDAAAATQPAKAPALNHAVRYDVDRRCVKLTAECPHRVAFAACGNFFCQTALAGHALLLSMHDKCAQAQRLVATLDELLHERLAARLEAEVSALRRAHRDELARLRDELQRFSKTQQTTLDAYARAAKFAHLLQTVDVEDPAPKDPPPKDAKRPATATATVTVTGAGAATDAAADAARQSTRPAERKSNEQLFVQAAGLSTDAFFHLRRQVDVIRETRAQHQRSVLDNARFEQEQAVQLLRRHGLALPQRFLRSLRDGYEDALRFQFAKVETLVQYLLQLTVAPLRGGRDLSVLPSPADRAHVRRVRRLAAELHSLHRVALGVFARLSEEIRGLFAQLHDERSVVRAPSRRSTPAAATAHAPREAAALRRSHSAAAALPPHERRGPDRARAPRAGRAPDAPQSGVARQQSGGPGDHAAILRRRRVPRPRGRTRTDRRCKPGSFTPLGTRRFRMTLEEQRAFARRQQPAPGLARVARVARVARRRRRRRRAAAAAAQREPSDDGRGTRSAARSAAAASAATVCGSCRRCCRATATCGARRRHRRAHRLAAGELREGAVSALEQLRLERRLCATLQASAAAPRPATPTAARDARDAREEAPVYCSWTCLKRWAYAARPPQQRYHVDLVVDVAAGCAVPP